GLDTEVAQLGLDGAQAPERLAQRVGGDEPAEALPGVDQPLVAQQLERLADGHPADAVRCRQLALAGQERAGRQLPPVDAAPQLLRDGAVADLTHGTRPPASPAPGAAGAACRL